jgi:malonate transporter
MRHLRFHTDRDVHDRSFLLQRVQPALFFAAAFALGVGRRPLDEGVLLALLPTAPLAVLLATRHGSYEDEASSTLALTMLGLAVALPIALVLLGAS